ncbi:MAG: diguanylate cyclase [Lachnospiraceae bacterium]|nr:diguanylate cyclase [Lachnospiraceae bacterium]MCI9398480.1 diguanylate cyclase [Lachnospiraceae bacterium]MCX4377561.1 diguanylate cyclase [Lachnospiraceae bacterium]
MKQFQFDYSDSETLNKKLSEFKEWCDSGNGAKKIFQIYSEELEPECIREVCDIIEKMFPNTLYMGCSTSGNIIDCQLSGRITIVCTVFELPSTQVQLYQYDLSKQSVDDITKTIVKETESNPWVKAMEMFFTIPEQSSTQFCEGLKNVRQDIQIFGGVACSDDITSDASCVFSKAAGFSEKSIIVMFYGGDDFYVDSIKVTGWKPLGRKFHVTKSKGSVLQELDGIPAYDVYHKYLNIKNDENFFYNTLEFPLFYEHNDTTILRTPVASNADGSITVTSDIDVGSVVRISYGDPGTIVDSIRHDSKKIAEFQPDLLHIFSCAARRTFWTSKEPTYEIQPFKEISPSCGFFSHGEFLRTNGNLNQHNVTLVIAAMREGEKKASVSSAVSPDENIMSKVPLVSRLATFISVTSLELEEINQQLALANEKLKTAAIIDGLTGLYNRREIQAQIEDALANIKKERFCLIMLDIDNFKQVNDTYGHQEGDTVIVGLADILRNEQTAYMQKVSSGRWGGEEFMMLLHDTDVSSASFIADLIRRCFANTNFPSVRPQTISLGVTQAKEEDTIDTLCTRVDVALYTAKKNGKNQVITR